MIALFHCLWIHCHRTQPVIRSAGVRLSFHLNRRYHGSLQSDDLIVLIVHTDAFLFLLGTAQTELDRSQSHQRQQEAIVVGADDGEGRQAGQRDAQQDLAAVRNDALDHAGENIQDGGRTLGSHLRRMRYIPLPARQLFFLHSGRCRAIIPSSKSASVEKTVNFPDR